MLEVIQGRVILVSYLQVLSVLFDKIVALDCDWCHKKAVISDFLFYESSENLSEPSTIGTYFRLIN